MATKKQKREAALTKRAEYLAKMKDEGLQAQRQDRAKREIEAAQLKEWADGYNDHCREILARHGVK